MPAFANTKINFGQILILILFIAVAFAFVSDNLSLVRSDLGLHLKNGQLFVDSFFINTNNFYSFTHTDFPFVNHHWGGGVILYLIFSLLGFGGLHIFFIVLSLLVFLLFFRLSARLSSFPIAAILGMAFLPTMASRTEIRPEMISYFLTGAFLSVLVAYREGSLPRQWLWLLPVLSLLWVNIHLFFIFSLVSVAIFAVDAGYYALLRGNPEAAKKFKTLIFIFLLCALAVLINPNFIRGAVYPFVVFSNYGAGVLENLPPHELKTYSPFVLYPYFILSFAIFFLSWLLRIFTLGFRGRLKNEFPVWEFLLSLFIALLAWTAIRNIAIYGLIAWLLASANFYQSFLALRAHRFFSRLSRVQMLWPQLAIASLLLVYFLNPAYVKKEFGVAAAFDPQPAAAEYLRQENIQGPIFNNYDVGAYLIYYFGPEQKVFVDARPEAYPGSFFSDTYLPVFEDEDMWQNLNEQYRFEAMVFYKKELNSTFHEFLARRLKDRQWRVGFDDGTIIVLVKTKP